MSRVVVFDRALGTTPLQETHQISVSYASSTASAIGMRPERPTPAALVATLEMAREAVKVGRDPQRAQLQQARRTTDSDAVLRLSSGTSLLHKLTTTGDLWDLEETLRRTTLYEGLDLNNTLSIDDLVNAALYGDRNSTETTVEGDVDGPLEEFLDDLVPDVNATGWIREILGVLSRFGENSLLLSDIATAKGAPLFRRAFRRNHLERGSREHGPVPGVTPGR
ncbi:hypothetical protein MRX96_043287 [Rhipicephalus microplus]